MKECEAEGNCERALTGREYWIAGASAATGVAVGLTLMYLYDPERGRRRRSFLLEQAASKVRRAQEDLSGKVEDAIHRTKGSVQEAVSRLSRREEEVADDVVRDRVRSRLGHLVPHANQVETEVKAGVVVLRGALRGALPLVDRSSLLNDLRRIPGVRGVEDLLEVAPAV